MKFAFCGNVACPEWVISSVGAISKMTSLKFKSLCQEVVASHLNDDGEKHNYPKMRELKLKVIDDKKFTEDDYMAVTAVVRFILFHAVRCALALKVFTTEMLQLGIPSEHVDFFGAVYEEALPQLSKKAASHDIHFRSPQSTRLTRLSQENGGVYRWDLTFDDGVSCFVINEEQRRSILFHLERSLNYLP